MEFEKVDSLYQETQFEIGDAFLSQDEVTEIRNQFDSSQISPSRVVFWTGMNRAWAQAWADQHEMKTLTSMMGPLMDIKNSSCPKLGKTATQWRRYIKGASALLAEYACTGGVVTVLTRPPPEIYSSRPHSTYRNIEERILKGLPGKRGASQITYVHPTVVGAEDYCYQAWPIDESETWVTLYGRNPSEQHRWKCGSSAPLQTQDKNQGHRKSEGKGKALPDARRKEQNGGKMKATEAKDESEKEARKDTKEKAKKTKKKTDKKMEKKKADKKVKGKVERKA